MKIFAPQSSRSSTWSLIALIIAVPIFLALVITMGPQTWANAFLIGLLVAVEFGLAALLIFTGKTEPAEVNSRAQQPQRYGRSPVARLILLLEFALWPFMVLILSAFTLDGWTYWSWWVALLASLVLLVVVAVVLQLHKGTKR